jgi:hypothetical protein
MRTTEFEEIRNELKGGKEFFVKHIVTHQVGKVISLGEEEFEVDVNGEHKTWNKTNCMKTVH